MVNLYRVENSVKFDRFLTRGLCGEIVLYENI